MTFWMPNLKKFFMDISNLSYWAPLWSGMPIWWVVIEISPQNLLHRVSILTVVYMCTSNISFYSSLSVTPHTVPYIPCGSQTTTKETYHLSWILSLWGQIYKLRMISMYEIIGHRNFPPWSCVSKSCATFLNCLEVSPTLDRFRCITRHNHCHLVVGHNV